MPTIAQTEFVASLYIGYFNRAPDPAGFMFWLGVVDAQAEALGAESPAFYKFLAEDLPQFFAENPEPRSVYPFLEAPSPESAEDFLTSVYQNLFGRNPDKAGLAFYRDALLVPDGQAGHLSPGQAISQIINGAVTAPDSIVVANKIDVGLFFVDNLLPKIGISDPLSFEGEARKSAETILTSINASTSSRDLAKSLITATIGAEDPSQDHTDGVFFEDFFFQTNSGSHETSIQGLKNLNVIGDIGDIGDTSKLVVNNSRLIIADDIELNSGRSTVSFSGEQTVAFLTGTTSSSSSVIRLSAHDGETASAEVFITDGAQVTVNHSREGTNSAIRVAQNSEAEIEDGVLIAGGQSATGTMIVEGDQTRVSIINSGGGDGSLSIASVERADDDSIDTTLTREADGLVVVRNGATMAILTDIHIADANNVGDAKANGALIVEGQGTRVTVGDESGIGSEGFMRIAEEGGTGTLILRDGAQMTLFSGEEYGGGIQLSGGSDRAGGIANVLISGSGTLLEVEDGHISVGRNIGEAHLTVSDGATLLARGISTAQNSTGTMIIEGETTHVTLGNEAGIGSEGYMRIAEEGGTGTLVLRDGAHMTLLPGEEYGGGIQLSGGSDRAGGIANALISGAGTLLEVEDGHIAVGRNIGEAHLTVSDGATLLARSISTAQNSTGTMTIEGSETRVVLRSEAGWASMDIGAVDTDDIEPTALENLSADGTVLIRDGATVSIENSITIGDANNVQGATATGTLIIEGESTRVTLGNEAGIGSEGFMRIAEEGGTGTLVLRDGAHMTLLPGEEYGGGIQLSGGSDRLGGTAHAEITGEGTYLLAVQGSIAVGRNLGTATFTLSDGADVDALFFTSGNDGTATTVIEGDGTTLTLSGLQVTPQYSAFLTVGRNAEGAFTVRDGAAVSIIGDGGPFPGIQVGRNEGAVGELTITGVGSSITIDGATNTATRSGESGFIAIGRDAGSSGTVNVLEGGLFQNDNDGVLIVAPNAASHGHLNINGIGSKFDFGATAYITPEKSGDGIVIVKNGGEIKGNQIINAGIMDVTSGGIVTADIENQGLLRSSSGIEDLIISGDLTSNTSSVSFEYLVSGSTLLHDTYAATGDVVLNNVLFLVGNASIALEGQVAEIISGNSITAGETFSVRFINADGNIMTENPQSILSNSNAGVELDFTLTETALSVNFTGISNLITDGISS